MINEKYDCYLVKQKDGTLMKFCYDSQQVGIYYQILINDSWSEKKSIYKKSFEHFYVLEESDEKIHVFCQDICGDIILCTLEGTELKYKILLHMKYDVIMPIYIRAFFHSDDIHLLYNVVDKHTYSEALVHQIARNGIRWEKPQIITTLDYCHGFPWRISQDSKSNIVLLNSDFSGGVYRLTSRNFHIIQERWGNQEVIYTSLSPFIDFTFCVEENRRHYLFITQDYQVNEVIYQYKEIGLQKEIVLFQHEKIDSCLLVISNKILWALWICGDELYGCFSTNYGQNFSGTRVYNHFNNELPVKVFYQEYSAEKQNDCISHEIYGLNVNEANKSFMQVTKQVIDNGSLKAKVDNSECVIDEPKDYFIKVKILKREKDELQEKLKIVEEELRRLHEARKYEKNQILVLRSQLYTEKEKIKSCNNYKNRLKDENSYLENKILLMDKEKIAIERKLAEKEKKNEDIKQQIDIIRAHNLSNSEQSIIESINDRYKQSRFSLIKWIFNDES